MAENVNEAADDAEADEGAPQKKKLPIKMIAIAAAAVLAVGGVGTGGYLWYAAKKKEEAEKAAQTPMVKPVAYVEVPDVMVNLSNPGSDRTQYLKVKIVLEVPDQELVKQITPIMPR